MELPINVIIILAISLLVLLVVSVFFGYNFISGTNSIDKNQLLSQMCVQLNCDKAQIFSVELKGEKLYKLCSSFGLTTANSCMRRCGCTPDANDFSLNKEPSFTDVPI